MSWNDDSWRDSYDEWKLASPYDCDPEQECSHDSFQIDMDGRAHCDNCLLSWDATAEEIAKQRETQADYDYWMAARERRELWRKLTLPIRWPIFRLLQRIWPRHAYLVLHDEEIPF